MSGPKVVNIQALRRQQRRESAARLRELGKVHDLVVYEGDTHGLQISGRERDERILEWFRRFDAVLPSP